MCKLSGSIDLSEEHSYEKSGHELERPFVIEVAIETQCHPIEQQSRFTFQPLHTLCRAFHNHGKLSAQQVAQVLERVALAWAKIARGDAEPKDFDG